MESNGVDGVEDKDCSWLPDFFVLTKRDVDYIQGFVHTEEQLKDLLRMHSDNTFSLFSSRYVYFIFFMITSEKTTNCRRHLENFI